MSARTKDRQAPKAAQKIDPLVQRVADAIPGAEVIPAVGSDYARLRVGDRTIAWLAPREKDGERLLRVDHLPAEALIHHAPAYVQRRIGQDGHGPRGLVVVSEDNFSTAVRYLKWAARQVKRPGRAAAAA